MCDIEKKLLAWIDGELPTKEAGDVARHVEGCEHCRGRLTAFREVDQSFKVYCDALIAIKAGRGVPRWIPALAGAVVAAVVLFLVFPRTRIAHPSAVTPTTATVSSVAPSRVSVPVAAEAPPHKSNRRRHVEPRRAQQEAVSWRPAESAVQIAIPADAMFAPGALPRGMNFVAELSLAPDGSVRQVRLLQ